MAYDTSEAVAKFLSGFQMKITNRERDTVAPDYYVKNEKQEDGTWKEVAGCGFKLFGFCTKKFTEKQAASLLDGKAVSLRGCKSKAGKTFDCTVVLQKDGSVEPIFTPRKPTKKGRR